MKCFTAVLAFDFVSVFYVRMCVFYFNCADTMTVDVPRTPWHRLGNEASGLWRRQIADGLPVFQPDVRRQRGPGDVTADTQRLAFELGRTVHRRVQPNVTCKQLLLLLLLSLSLLYYYERMHRRLTGCRRMVKYRTKHFALFKVTRCIPASHASTTTSKKKDNQENLH